MCSASWSATYNGNYQRFFINNKKINALTRASNGHTNELHLKRPLTWYVHSTTTTEYATAQALTTTATATTTTSYIGTVNNL